VKHVTIRRYEGVDPARAEQLSRKTSETLVPHLKQFEGLSGYYLIEFGNGVLSSVGLFASVTQAVQATTIAAAWVKDERLETAPPHAPPITSGEVLVHENGVSSPAGS
jgi:hypothetical protein